MHAVLVTSYILINSILENFRFLLRVTPPPPKKIGTHSVHVATATVLRINTVFICNRSLYVTIRSGACLPPFSILHDYSGFFIKRELCFGTWMVCLYYIMYFIDFPREIKLINKVPYQLIMLPFLCPVGK